MKFKHFDIHIRSHDEQGIPFVKVEASASSVINGGAQELSFQGYFKLRVAKKFIEDMSEALSKPNALEPLMMKALSSMIEDKVADWATDVECEQENGKQ